MVNKENSPAVVKAIASDGQMMALLNASGLKPALSSPLAKINGTPSALNNLKSSGLTDNNNQPTPDCREALTILANPASETDLLWGNADGISLSKVYGAAGQDRLVSFTSLNSSNNIAYFLTSQDITDLIIEKLAYAEIKNPPPLNVEVDPAAIPVFFAVMDTYREAQLKASLERRQELSVNTNAEELNRLIQEAKLETDHSWYSPAALAAMPPDAAITQATVTEGLNQLKREGMIGAGGELSDSLTALAYRAFPLMGFSGIKVLTAGAGSVNKTQLALFRGPAALLLVQLSEENNGRQASISSISTSQLPELLFNLGTLQQQAEIPAAPAPAAPGKTVVCDKCRTENDTSAKFCRKCGAPLEVPVSDGPKFCPKCGDPVTAGEKFCNKCGNRLK